MSKTVRCVCGSCARYEKYIDAWFDALRPVNCQGLYQGGTKHNYCYDKSNSDLIFMTHSTHALNNNQASSLSNRFHQQLTSSTTRCIDNRLHQQMMADFIRNLFMSNRLHEQPVSSAAGFTNNWLRPQQPVSSANGFISNRFHQQPVSWATGFISSRFHQQLSSPAITGFIINRLNHLLLLLRSSIGGVAYVTAFNSSATWAATFRLRG